MVGPLRKKNLFEARKKILLMIVERLIQSRHSIFFFFKFLVLKTPSSVLSFFSFSLFNFTLIPLYLYVSISISPFLTLSTILRSRGQVVLFITGKADLKPREWRKNGWLCDPINFNPNPSLCTLYTVQCTMYTVHSRGPTPPIHWLGL